MKHFGKIGVLLVNLGTPDNPKRPAVYRYLKQFLLDPRVIDYPWLPRNLLVRGLIIPFRAGKSAKLYQQLWTQEGSPLKVYGERVAVGVQQELGEEYEVVLAMRYQNPSIENGIRTLLDRGVREIVVFPMFPQYASASTGSVHDEVMRLLRKEQTIPNVRFINSFYDYEPLIDLFISNAQQFDLESYDHIIFSYHGLPQRHLIKGDRNNHCLQSGDCCQTIGVHNQFCYSAQCHATTAAIVAKLQLTPDQYTTTFQSRLNDKWVKPFTDDVIEEMAAKGAKRLLIFSPAFVADCLETVIELGVEYQEDFEKFGGDKVDYVPSLNDDPRWIKAVADLVKKPEYSTS